MFNPNKLALAAVLSAVATSAIPCVQFDTSFNLYAFGGSQDVKIGASSTFGSPSTTTLTTTGRPPWTGNYTQCILNQNNNLMFVLGADSSDVSKIYIYSFTSNTWSTQTTSSAPSNIGNSRSSSVLDHDTSVIYTLPGGSSQSQYQLDMSTITTGASSSALAWEAVENPSFSTDGYTVTAAQAANHISYFGVPGTAAGSADLFVVHFAYFQPTAQSFPTQNGGATFPDTPGQAISIPSSSNNVPYQMVFVPNDFSSTYIISHWTDLSNYSITSDAPFATSLINTTQILPAPTSKDTQASYAASDSSIVQIDSAGNIYYINSAINTDYTVSSSAAWTKMGYTLPGTGGSVSSSSASGSSSAASASGSATGSASGTTKASSATGSSTNSASAAAATTSKSAGMKVAKGDLVGLALGVAALGAAALL